MMTLRDVPPGTKVKVIGIHNGKRIVMRLMQMGIYPGTVIEVIDNRGSIMIRVRGSIVALGKGIASKILIALQ